jgi:predicted helicase
VRAVDDVLQTHFNLPQGLADTSTTTIQVTEKSPSGKSTVKLDKIVHRVQVLDVATGTGTFLAEVISQIHSKYKAQQGMWSSYVEQHLIPRVHGFELLMASYAMCHLKLELLLRETGYVPKGSQAPRLSVYLTNSLEKPHDELDKLPLIEWFSRESNEASFIKKRTPIMVALGNPPYSGESDNRDPWIMNLLEDYKKEPTGGRLQEANPKWLNDDYVKFIRFGAHFVEKNKDGIVAFITNHSWLDNPTFRGMRWHMLNTFDDIFVFDLHGSTKKKDTAPDGSADKNVFDIQQGVAIFIAVKHKSGAKLNKPLANVHHAEVWGSRESKYTYLSEASLKTMPWQKLAMQAPHYFMVPKNMVGYENYTQGFAVNELFKTNQTGMVTARDALVVANDIQTLAERIRDFADVKQSDEAIRAKYYGHKKAGKYLPGDSGNWKLVSARRAIAKADHADFIKPVAYRPFDNGYVYYHDEMIEGARGPIMKHFTLGSNLALLVGRQGQVAGNGEWNLVFSCKNISDFNMFYRGGGLIMPLYLYDGLGKSQLKTPNLDEAIWRKIKDVAGAAAAEPQAVFDYVYAVLHAPTYRRTYAEFLKSDFPRIPYPTSAAQFKALAAHGATLRQLHLLEHPNCTPTGGMAAYPTDGSHVVEKVSYAGGKVFINATQHFDNVPQAAWEFYIGGYQPAQKWLKDRKGRALSLDDITHYQRIIATLTQTAQLMQVVDGVYKAAK